MITSSMVLRIARPSEDLKSCIRFYADGLGMDVLSEFEDHDGFDGIVLGGVGFPWHLEFTRNRGHVSGPAPGMDNLLVFYCENSSIVDLIANQMALAGFHPVVSSNPYWDEAGLTFEDHDGYRIVLCSKSWRAGFS